MPDQPALSEPANRKLAIQWHTIRDNHKITDEQLSGYDLGRQWLLGALAKRPRDMNLGGLNTSRPKQAAGWLGLDPSVRAAEAQFRGIDSDYWSCWCSSGFGHEVYRDWLDSVTRQVSAELAKIWKGRSDVTDRWFDSTCAPAIEKALGVILKRRIAQARDVETKRLERPSSKAPTGTGNPVADEILARANDPESMRRLIESGDDGLSPLAQRAVQLARTRIKGANSDSNRQKIQIRGPEGLDLIISPAADCWMWSIWNGGLGPIEELRLELCTTRSFDAKQHKFRKPVDQAFRWPLQKDIQAGLTKPAIFLRIDGDNLRLYNSDATPVLTWPTGNQTRLRCWCLNLKIIGLSKEWPIDLLVQWTLGDETFELMQSSTEGAIGTNPSELPRENPFPEEDPRHEDWATFFRAAPTLLRSAVENQKHANEQIGTHLNTVIRATREERGELWELTVPTLRSIQPRINWPDVVPTDDNRLIHLLLDSIGDTEMAALQQLDELTANALKKFVLGNEDVARIKPILPYLEESALAALGKEGTPFFRRRINEKYERLEETARRLVKVRTQGDSPPIEASDVEVGHSRWSLATGMREQRSEKTCRESFERIPREALLALGLRFTSPSEAVEAWFDILLKYSPFSAGHTIKDVGAATKHQLGELRIRALESGNGALAETLSALESKCSFPESLHTILRVDFCVLPVELQFGSVSQTEYQFEYSPPNRRSASNARPMDGETRGRKGDLMLLKETGGTLKDSVSYDHACLYLGVSRRQVERLVSEKKGLTVTGRGHNKQISVSSLLAYLPAQKTT